MLRLRKKPLISENDRFEHGHLCRHPYPPPFPPPWNNLTFHHQKSCLSPWLIWFYHQDHSSHWYGAETMLPCKLPPLWRIGLPPAPNCLSLTSPICLISHLGTSCCFQRWKDSWLASHLPRRASRRPGEGWAELSPPRRLLLRSAAGLSGGKSANVSALTMSRKAKKQSLFSNSCVLFYSHFPGWFIAHLVKPISNDLIY